MRLLAVANQKGGVGKTTVTINLAAAAASAGRRVLVIDADPQGHATVALGRPALYTAQPPHLAGVLMGDTPGIVLADLVDFDTWLPAVDEPYVPAAGGVDLLPSCPAMFLAEPRLAAQRGREQRLARLLAGTELADRYDLVLIDCPPSLGVLTDNALVAAGEVLIVAGADPASLHGLDLLVDQIRSIHDALGVRVAVAGLVVNSVDPTRVARQTLERFALLGLPVIAEIPKRTLLREAWAEGRPVQDFERPGPGTLTDTFAALAATLDIGEHLQPAANR